MKYEVNKSAWIRFFLTDAEGNPKTGLIYSDVSVKYIKYGQTSFTTKTLDTTNFRELGNGIYEVQFTGTELDTLGSFIVFISPATPGLFVPVAKEDEISDSAGLYKVVGGPYSLTIRTLERADNSPIPNVSVYLLQSDKPQFYLLTDSNGVGSLNVVEGTYDIRAYKTGYVFTTITTTITASTEITALGDELTLPAPSQPDLCRVYVRTVDLGISGVSGVDVMVNYETPEEVGTAVGVSKWVTYKTDADGITYFDAPKGCNVLVRIPKAGLNVKITIPTDKNSVYLTDLIEV
jgi:hypothetical protein